VSNTKVWRPPHRQGKAVNIELAAYVLQLKVERSGVASAIPILKWISGQRNANGGFSSTQVSSFNNLIKHSAQLENIVLRYSALNS